MDLRIQRTKKAIREAFLELRRKKPVEKITVTELSKLARINKATFYLHYTDIYKLSDEIEDETIEEIIASLNNQDKFFDRPSQYASDFALEIFHVFFENREKLHSVFSGSRYSVFSVKIEQRIKSLLFQQFPEMDTRSNNISLTFLIQGVFHTLSDIHDDDNPEDYNIIAGFTSEIFERLVTQNKKV